MAPPTVRKLVLSALAAAKALPCQGQSADPVGPAGWTLRNWAGLALQITVFILALIGIFRIAGWDGD